MPLNYKTIILPNVNSRKEIRDYLIKEFLSEDPGTGKGENCSKYIYYVDELGNGNRVYLFRPAALNKGVDFEVHVEGIKFREKGKVTMPSHTDIFEDLKNKKNANASGYLKVIAIVNDLFLCKDVDNQILRGLTFTTGHPIEAILKAIKWLFIEQDVTYWNWSGRYMLFNGLKENNLC